MKLIIQRVSRAAVSVADELVGQIGAGLVLFVGFSQADQPTQAAAMAKKVAELRIFSDDQGKLSRDISQSGGQILSISQFTLLAQTDKGRRPDFSQAAEYSVAEQLYQQFNDYLRAAGLSVATGRFGAQMLVSLDNDGPVTIILES